MYEIDLAGGRLSVYLDPGRPGFNGIHATFADAQERELNIAGAPKITTSRIGETPSALPVFQEGPGHFCADFRLEARD